MKNPVAIVLLSLAATAIAFAQDAPKVTITPQNDGLHIQGDSEHLKFTLGYPILSTGDKKKDYGNKGVEVKDNTATVKYEGGGELDIAVDAATGTIVIKGQNLPAEVASVSMRMIINQNFNVGGTYQFAGKEVQPFPEVKPDKPHLFQGNVANVTIRAGDGKGLIFTVPLYSYQEITDMREWGTNSFGWMTLANYSPDTALTYKIEDAGAAPAAADGASTNAAPAMP